LNILLLIDKTVLLILNNTSSVEVFIVMMKKFTREELSKYNGNNGTKSYIGYN
jgi:hypothetical protein